MSNLLDQDVVFFGTLNCLPVTTQSKCDLTSWTDLLISYSGNRYTNQERLQIVFPRVPLPNRKQISLTESVDVGQVRFHSAVD